MMNAAACDHDNDIASLLKSGIGTSNEIGCLNQIIAYEFSCELGDVGETFAKTAVRILYECFQRHLALNNSDELRSSLIQQLRAALFHTVSSKLCNVINRVYQIAFNVNNKLNKKHVNDSSFSGTSCVGCQSASCECLEISKLFTELQEMLSDMGLLDRLTNDAVVKVARETIKEKVNCVTARKFDCRHLAPLEEWLQDSVIDWLRTASGKETMVDPESEIHRNQCARLRHELHRQLAESLIKQMFDIIADYPDSKPALLDLKDCLKRVSLRSRLVSHLQDDIAKRLLHPGVETTQVLMLYTYAVKSLRILDPSGVIMDAVCQPVRAYIRNRADSVRCIVLLLTEGGHMDKIKSPSDTATTAGLLGNNESLMDHIFEENDESMQNAEQNIKMEVDSSDDGQKIDPIVDLQTEKDGLAAVFGADGVKWAKWKPDPVDALPDDFSEARRSADMVSMLVGIYGSRELFVNEYRQLLSERLLRQSTHDIETETRYLHMLKTRFGASELHHCEVMLKDVKDSERIRDFICDTNNLPLPVNARILSAHFWPKLKDDRLQLPESIQQALEKYKSCYESYKVSRTLEWHQQLGTVDLELCIGGTQLKLTVTPLQAAVIWKFQEKDEWTSDELSSSLHVTASAVRRRLHAWSQLGVLIESKSATNGSSSWRLSTELPSHVATQTHALNAPHDLSQDDEEEEAHTAKTNNEVDALEQYWTYVQNLLLSLDSVKPDRLQTLLRMFASPGQEGPSLETVVAFLQRKVNDQLLINANGQYKLVAKKK